MLINLQPWLIISFVAILTTINAAKFVTFNYDIEYKMWFSFVGQLFGLIFFVTSLVGMMLVLFNYLSQMKAGF